MNSQDLQAYLDAYRSEGEFDSEGYFTLDRQKAVGKIARYLLPEEGLWILKAVQAAALLKVKELRVKEVRAYSSLAYSLLEPVSAVQLRKGLVEETEVEGLRPLCQALRSVAQTQKRLVTVTLSTRNSKSLFLINDGQVSESEIEQANPPPERSTLTILVQRPIAGADTLFDRGKEALRFAEDYLEGHRSEEFQYLIDRARVSPVPLWLNGTRIDDLNIPWYLGPGERTYYVGALYAESENPEENYLRIPRGISRKSEGRFLPGNHGPLASLSFNPFTRANCLLGVHYCSTVEPFSRLHLAKHGVIVDTVTSDFGATIGFDLVISPPQIKTDLTGLRGDIPASVTRRYRRYLVGFRNPLKKLALYLTGPSFAVQSFQAPREFEGLEFGSKLRMFAAGRLKKRRDAGQNLEWTLSRAPFNVPEVGRSRA